MSTVSCRERPRPSAAGEIIEDDAPPGRYSRQGRAVVFRRPLTAQAAVLQELRRSILEGELKPGTQIVQDAFAERLGLSRVPVREALKILEGEGQVRYSPHRGYFVTELDISELLEIYRIRELLETETVRNATPKLTDEDVTRLSSTIDSMAAASEATDIVALTNANREFHFALFTPSGMPRFVRMIRQLWDSSDPYRSLYFADPGHRDVVDAEHRGILDAARARDAEALVRLLDEHRANAITGLKKVLDHA
ncbi:GntR family transcriptional regulator [Mycobacterium tuberculosis]|nr:GntR family transcriptional regulator [Mycobacterium tuberculosis]